MGGAISAIKEGFPPKAIYNVQQIPDLSGKVIIVTGGATGIGAETVKQLLLHNAKVYIAGRSQAKAEATILRLKEITGKEALFFDLDLASLASVRKAALEFSSKESRLDVLINNGGVMAPPKAALTVEGYDLQFGTNVLGHFYFTKLLLPVLIGTAKTTGTPARVVNVASSAHWLYSGPVRIPTLVDGPARDKEAPQGLYNQSKFGNIVFATELARRYGSEGIISTALNPGNINSELARHYNAIQKWLVKKIVYDVPHGALTQVYAATSPEGVDFNGKYLIPWARVAEASKAAVDPAHGKELWAWLEEQVFTFEKTLI